MAIADRLEVTEVWDGSCIIHTLLECTGFHILFHYPCIAPMFALVTMQQMYMLRHALVKKNSQKLRHHVHVDALQFTRLRMLTERMPITHMLVKTGEDVLKPT